jgi:hypothetical protein
MRIWMLAWCAALALGTVAACGTDGSTTKALVHDSGVHDAGGHDAGSAALRVLVGAVDDTDIAVGAVVADRRARMFFCGGPSSYASATHWFPLVDLDADADADAGFEQVAADGFMLRGSLQGTTLRGELTRKGEPSATFSAELVRAGTLAGLYENTGDCGRIGLIVTQPTVKGAVHAQGACVGPGHLPQQVNPILPVTLGADGSIRVDVVADDGTQSARVHVADGPSTP